MAREWDQCEQGNESLSCTKCWEFLRVAQKPFLSRQFRKDQGLFELLTESERSSGSGTMNCNVSRCNTRVNCYWDCEKSTDFCHPLTLDAWYPYFSRGRHCARSNHKPMVPKITSTHPTLCFDEYAN